MQELNTQSGRILIVDDEKGNIKVLERFLKVAGYSHLKSVSDSRQAVRNNFV